jgi:type IV secretory pathway VirB4 component
MSEFIKNLVELIDNEYYRISFKLFDEEGTKYESELDGIDEALELYAKAVGNMNYIISSVITCEDDGEFERLSYIAIETTKFESRKSAIGIIQKYLLKYRNLTIERLNNIHK